MKRFSIVLLSFYCFSGAPTATLQSWPGCPCGGFILAPLVLLPVLLLAGKLTAGAGVAVWFIMGCAVAGAPPFSGAPTATLQSWPGCPCGGFTPAVPVLLPCGRVAVLPGDAGVDVAGLCNNWLCVAGGSGIASVVFTGNNTAKYGSAKNEFFHVL
jgi:hypothetical protein